MIIHEVALTNRNSWLVGLGSHTCKGVTRCEGGCSPVADDRPPYGDEAIDAHQHHGERPGEHVDARHGVVDAAENCAEHPSSHERRRHDHRQTEQKQRVSDGQVEPGGPPDLCSGIKSEDAVANSHSAARQIRGVKLYVVMKSEDTEQSKRCTYFCSVIKFEDPEDECLLIRTGPTRKKTRT